MSYAGEALHGTASAARLADRLRAEHDRRWTARTPLDEVCFYALWPAGKLIRPMLMTEACLAVGGDPEKIPQAALSLEYFHTASLIHDDIVDGAGTRRGRTSVPARFGLTAALVAGDELVFQIFRACAEAREAGLPAERVLAAVTLLAETGIELCRGQYAEHGLSGDADTTLARYCDIAAGKTAPLLVASCQVGAILGGGNPAEVAALAEFARYFGIAFQMADDLRPYRGLDEEPDKDRLADVVSRRMTFPLVIARHELADRAREVLAEAFRPGADAAESYEALSALVSEPVVDVAIAKILAEYVDRAVGALRPLRPGAGRDRLASLAEAIASGAGYERSPAL